MVWLLAISCDSYWQLFITVTIQVANIVPWLWDKQILLLVLIEGSHRWQHRYPQLSIVHRMAWPLQAPVIGNDRPQACQVGARSWDKPRLVSPETWGNANADFSGQKGYMEHWGMKGTRFLEFSTVWKSSRSCITSSVGKSAQWHLCWFSWISSARAAQGVHHLASLTSRCKRHQKCCKLSTWSMSLTASCSTRHRQPQLKQVLDGIFGLPGNCALQEGLSTASAFPVGIINHTIIIHNHGIIYGQTCSIQVLTISQPSTTNKVLAPIVP